MAIVNLAKYSLSLD